VEFLSSTGTLPYGLARDDAHNSAKTVVDTIGLVGAAEEFIVTAAHSDERTHQPPVCYSSDGKPETKTRFTGPDGEKSALVGAPTESIYTPPSLSSTRVDVQLAQYYCCCCCYCYCYRLYHTISIHSSGSYSGVDDSYLQCPRNATIHAREKALSRRR